MRGAVLLLTLGVVAGLLAASLTAERAAGEVGVPEEAAAATAPTPEAALPSDEPVDSPGCRPAPLATRAGQVLFVGLPGVRTAREPVVAAVLAARVGGVLLTGQNVGSAKQVRALVDGLKAGRDIPLLVTTDEEGGRVSSFRALLGPGSSARTLAATGSPADTGRRARALGEQLTELGVDLDLAPVLDLDGSSGGVIGDRSFSAEPETAAAHGLAFSAGLAAGGVVPTAKHFPGHGASGVDPHRRTARDRRTLSELHARDLVPFLRQIDAGVPVVMLGHVTYPALDRRRPASLSPAAYTLLRDLGFQGVAITDSVGMGAVHRRWKFPRAAVMAIRAGADAVLATDGRQAGAMRDALVRAVRSGRLDEDRLNEAVARVLGLKGVDPVPVACTAVSFPQQLLP